MEPGRVLVLEEWVRPGWVSGGGLKVVQWNIERGYKLDAVISELARLQADVICAQELDVGCDRSGGRDCPAEIARALGMWCAYVVEFDELRSPLRCERDQGGGVHCNALFSRVPLGSVRAFPHSRQPVDWEREGESRREPRRGARFVLCAELETLSVAFYSLHLEVFCGALDRVWQFSDVLRDVRRAGASPRCVVCGDLNTMCTGIARLSPKYNCDCMRWLSLGRSEARWFTDTVLSVPWSEGEVNAELVRLGLPEAVCREALNVGLSDPFDPDVDITVQNHWGLFAAKLDWILLGGLQCEARSMGNDDFVCSDHRWMSVSLSI